MSNITIITGAAGSGKSTLLRKMEREGVLIIDEFTADDLPLLHRLVKRGSDVAVSVAPYGGLSFEIVSL